MAQKPMRVTRADVAREAGVTETIVSYVINANRYVDSEKCRRVKAAIKKLHYIPNTMARALKGKKTNHILFIADDITGNHFGEIISEMDRIAYDKGYFISLCADKNDKFFIQRIFERFFDGIIIASCTFSEQYIQNLIQSQIPVVLFKIRNYRTFEGTYGQINTGLYEGARLCVKALYEKGRRSLLFIDRLGEKPAGKIRQDERLRGFTDQCKEFGLDFSSKHIVQNCADETELIRKIEKRFSARNHPDGIFARTDSVACAAMQGIKQAGLLIPKDVSVIGFNNSPQCKYTVPRLSSIQINRAEAAKYAVELLEKLIDNNTDEKTTAFCLNMELHTELIIRESL